MNGPLVLTVEDDAAIRRGIVDSLRFAGYDVAETADGEQAVSIVVERPVALLLLDLVLPGIDGFAVLDRVRKIRPTLPVIMLTARGREEDRVGGLRSGADDYVVKPFGVKELLARVEAVLRRSPQRIEAGDRFEIAGGAIDLARGEYRPRDDRAAVSLSQRECDLLRYLRQHGDRVVTRDELLQFVWQLDPKGLSTRTIDMHVARLRDKLSTGSGTEEVIETVRGRGYRLAVSGQGSGSTASDG